MFSFFFWPVLRPSVCVPSSIFVLLLFLFCWFASGESLIATQMAINQEKNRQMCKKDREEEGSEKEGGGNTHTKKSFSRGAGAVNGPIRNHFTRCHSSGSFNWCLGLIRLIWIPAGSLAPVQGSLWGSLCGPCSNAVGSGFSGFFSAGRRIDWKRIGSTLELTCQPFGSIK